MSKPRLLLVEDNLHVNKLLTDYLGTKGYDVASFLDGPPALEFVRTNGLPHLALIDLGLPSMDGFEVAQKLKSRSDVPIIFVTAEGAPSKVETGLTLYAEDYVVKPFDLSVMAARVKSVLKRLAWDHVSAPTIQVDARLKIHLSQGQVSVDGKRIDLTPIESKLLHVLYTNRGKIVENRLLISRIWSEEEVYEDTLRVHVHRLRTKIEKDPHKPEYLLTERGVGYRFAAVLEDVTPALPDAHPA